MLIKIFRPYPNIPRATQKTNRLKIPTYIPQLSTTGSHEITQNLASALNICKEGTKSPKICQALNRKPKKNLKPFKSNRLHRAPIP